MLVGGAVLYSFLTPVTKSGLLDVAAGAGADQYDPRSHFWGFIVDNTKCIGCGRCVLACKLENNVPFGPSYNRTWVERYRMTEDGEFVVDSPNSGIDGFVVASENEEGRASGEAPAGSASADREHRSFKKAFFVPKLCNQCENPPCVQVCPVGASYKTQDGVILIDQPRCIGCKYCIEACPYAARYLVPKGERTPGGEVHVADKCTWCYHRITKGRQPACVEVCPVGARIAGDMTDPESPVSRILREQRVSVLKPELGTKPKVYYIGLEGGVR